MTRAERMEVRRRLRDLEELEPRPEYGIEFKGRWPKPARLSLRPEDIWGQRGSSGDQTDYGSIQKEESRALRSTNSLK